MVNEQAEVQNSAEVPIDKVTVKYLLKSHVKNPTVTIRRKSEYNGKGGTWFKIFEEEIGKDIDFINQLVEERKQN